MKCIKINQKGKAHKNGKCEDALFINLDNTVFCLADGVSNSRYGAEGANYVVETCGKAFSSPDFKDLLKNESVEVVRNAICKIIDNTLEKLCIKANERDKEVFASTFLALIKTGENDVTLIHAGDGAIFGRPKTEQTYFATILSYPDNTPDGKVYSAGHPEQRNRMRIIRVKIDDYDSIMLCTDGFSEAYLLPSFQAYNINAITEVFNVKNEAELAELVQREHIFERDISDDISCILCFMDDNMPISFDNGYKHTVVTDDEYNAFNFPREKNTARRSETVTINQTEFNQSRKISKQNKSDKLHKGIAVVLSAIIILALLFSFVMFIHIKSSNKTDKAQNTEISLLHEQVSCIEEKLNEVENELHKKDVDITEVADIENNERTTSDEATITYWGNNTETETSSFAPFEPVY